MWFGCDSAPVVGPHLPHRCQPRIQGSPSLAPYRYTTPHKKCNPTSRNGCPLTWHSCTTRFNRMDHWVWTNRFSGSTPGCRCAGRKSRYLDPASFVSAWILPVHDLSIDQNWFKGDWNGVPDVIHLVPCTGRAQEGSRGTSITLMGNHVWEIGCGYKI